MYLISWHFAVATQNGGHGWRWTRRFPHGIQRLHQVFMLLQQFIPPASCQGGTIDGIIGKLNVKAILGNQVYCRHGRFLDDKDIVADDMVEAADSGYDSIPVFHTEAVI